MNQNALLPLMYVGMIAFEQQMFKYYFDYSKYGKEIQAQIQKEAKFIANKDINSLNSQLNPRDIEEICQFRTLYRLQELKRACDTPKIYYLYPFAIPFSLLYPKISTIIFGFGFTCQSFVFISSVIKLKFQSQTLQTNRKQQEFMDSGITLLMITLGTICGAVLLKRGAGNLIEKLKAEKAFSKEITLQKENAQPLQKK